VHRCPQCDYAYGPLPGVPRDRFGEFTADVRCPECAFKIPKGARLIVGSSIEAGSQPLTARRRTAQVLLALAPVGYLVFFGMEGLVSLLAPGVSGITAWNAIRTSLLAIGVLVAWRAWRRWTPRDADDGRAQASFDVRWLCLPDGLRTFYGTPSGPSDADPPSARKFIASADIRSIVARSPYDRGKRWRVGDRAVACLSVTAWHRGSDGRRADMWEFANFVDTGADAGPPGKDRAFAIIEAGDAIARGMRRTLGIAASADAEHPGAGPLPEDAPATIVVEGALHALPPWPARAMVPAFLIGMPVAIAIFSLLAFAIMAVVRVIEALPNNLPAWMPLSLAGCAAFVAVFLPLLVFLLRRSRVREFARCRWEVGARGIRVTELHADRKGNPTGESGRDIPGERIATIAAIPVHGRIRLVARDRSARELAGVTLDSIPEQGAEALAQRIRELAWGGGRRAS